MFLQIKSQGKCWSHLSFFFLFKIQVYAAYFPASETVIWYILSRFPVVYGKTEIQLLGSVSKCYKFT